MKPSLLTFIVKSIDAVDAGTLVVAAQHEEVLRIFDLVRQQQAYRFQRLFTAVNVVSEEQVITFRWKATVLKQPQQVVILSVDITWYTSDIICTCK